VRAVATVLRLVNLRRLPTRPVRTLLGVAGVGAAVMLIASVGVLADTLDRSLYAGSGDPSGVADVEVLPSDATGLRAADVRAVRRAPGVAAALPVVRAELELRGPGGRRRALVLGTDRRVALRLEPGGEPIRVESGSADPRGAGLLLSPALARELGVAVGGTVTVVAPTGPRAIAGAGRVAGGALAGLGTDRVALLRLRAAQELLGRAGRVDAIYVVSEPGRAAEATAAIERRLAGRAAVGRPGALERGYDRAFRPVRTLSSLAAVAGLFVAAVLVFNTMAMTVAERRREIAMMRALGAPRHAVTAAFVAEAALVGVVGSLVGVAAGVAVSDALAAWVGELPLAGEIEPVVRAPRLALAVAAGTAVAVAAAALATRRIAAVEPIEGVVPEGAHDWSRAPRARPRLQAALGALALAGAIASLAASSAAPGQGWIAALTLALWLVVTVIVARWTVPLAVRTMRLVAGRRAGSAGRLALEDLLRQPERLSLTTVAIVVSVGLVLAVGAASDSYRSGFVERVEAAFGAPLYVLPQDVGSPVLMPPLDGALADRIARLPAVAAAYPERSLFVEADGEPLLLRAAPVARAAREGTTRRLISVGDRQPALLAALARGEVAISEFTRRQLGLDVGDRLTLATATGPRRLRVGAAWEGTAAFNEAYLERDVYERLWRDRDATRIAVYPAPGRAGARAEEQVEALLGRAGSARVVRSGELVGEAVALMDRILDLGRAVQLACLLVAIVAVASTMAMSVLERRWELALRRMIGETRGALGRSLLAESAAIGYIGGLGGALFGTAGGLAMTRAMNVGYGWELAYRPPLLATLVAMAAAALVAAAAGLPALRLAVAAPIANVLRAEVGGAPEGGR
jgi:putative ABC transport system permease protein